jgi:hypothetical protein
MTILKVEHVKLFLKKINAINIKKSSDTFNDKSIEESKSEKKEIDVEVNVAFRQKENKDKCIVFISYKIPSISEFDLEIDAEFVGEAYFKEPFDFENLSDEDERVKADFPQVLLPNMLKEVDKILKPIFHSMGAEYEDVSKKK